MTIHTYKTPWRMHVKDSIENSVMVLNEVISYTNIVDSPTQLTCFVILMFTFVIIPKWEIEEKKHRWAIS